MPVHNVTTFMSDKKTPTLSSFTDGEKLQRSFLSTKAWSSLPMLSSTQNPKQNTKPNKPHPFFHMIILYLGHFVKPGKNAKRKKTI